MALDEDRLTQKLETAFSSPTTQNNKATVARAMAKAIIEEIKQGKVSGSDNNGDTLLPNTTQIT